MTEDREKRDLTADDWLDRIEERLLDKGRRPLEIAQKALQHFPDDGAMLELAAFAAIVEEEPDLSLRYLKKLERMYYPIPGTFLCRAIALAQLGKWPLAQQLLERIGASERYAHHYFPPAVDWRWAQKWVHDILHWKPRAEEARKQRDVYALRKSKTEPAAPKRSAAVLRAQAASGESPEQLLPPLPRFIAKIPIRFDMPDPQDYELLDRNDAGSAEDFVLRLDLAHAALFQTFDELMCLPQLCGVDHYWFQVETARKVLKQFRGRVLLADEVGLGKTIEAGMVLKEYILRGMVERVLILTPPSLVGQWREEMATKFGLEFLTTQDALIHRDPPAFWAHPRIIASIATARRELHSEHITQLQFDLVIVDEAHHLKNRSSKNWKFVDGLKRRFLLLLSATPIQNSLIEIYNLLTLLKPGIFKTEKEFRSIHVTPGNPRLPANRERLQELMRDVMVRNTRALVDVRLPPRRAATVIAEPTPEELACYQELSRLLRSLPEESLVQHRMALHHLLEAAGSSPRAAQASLERFAKPETSGEWRELQERYSVLARSAKSDALVSLLDRNPSEKKMVFVRFRETLHMLSDLLAGRSIPFSRFDGSLSGPEKDGAIEKFREEVPVLLSTESGGEGRNLQFCNTLINFDLPWNPQLIEQRIGRIHRIGQAREVFIFNLALKHTVEERILQILNEKIHMFELVVGEVQSFLGEMEEDQAFANLVFAAWVAQTEEGRGNAFDRLSEQLLAAKRGYETAKALDDEVFGEEFEVA
jgi:superfamily II DNA or RNA helicase